jgi:hypothetical protein
MDAGSSFSGTDTVEGKHHVNALVSEFKAAHGGAHARPSWGEGNLDHRRNNVMSPPRHGHGMSLSASLLALPTGAHLSSGSAFKVVSPQHEKKSVQEWMTDSQGMDYLLAPDGMQQ